MPGAEAFIRVSSAARRKKSGMRNCGFIGRPGTAWRMMPLKKRSVSKALCSGRLSASAAWAHRRKPDRACRDCMKISPNRSRHKARLFSAAAPPGAVMIQAQPSVNYLPQRTLFPPGCPAKGRKCRLDIALRRFAALSALRSALRKKKSTFCGRRRNEGRAWEQRSRRSSGLAAGVWEGLLNYVFLKKTHSTVAECAVAHLEP